CLVGLVEGNSTIGLVAMALVMLWWPFLVLVGLCRAACRGNGGAACPATSRSCCRCTGRRIGAVRRLASLLPLLAMAACATAPPVRVLGDDVFADGRLAARYVHAPYDPADERATCKVYHHVFAPDARLLTKGPGGTFEHHRGLFVGWNQTRQDGRRFDFWHMNRGESQRHRGFVPPQDLGLDAAWQVAAIDWCDADGAAIVRERRALRATALGRGSQALDVVVELRAGGDAPVELGGDPQHSGHQFRALEAFAPADAPKVTYVRPPGSVAHADDVWTDCAWIAVVLPLADGPVTVLRVEDPANAAVSRDLRWSTRDYGRFGATCSLTLQPGRPVRLAYRYVVALGALDAARCAELARPR
ncbi:MAG: DUF6807 family protein, partial [Planctomycetota bacterium]